MMNPSITVDRKLKRVTIVMALESARPSKATGKTMLIASTRGLKTSTETYAHRPVCFTANVLYFPARPDPEFSSEDRDTPQRHRKPPSSWSKAKKQRVDRRSDSVRMDDATTGTAVSDRGKN
jgi:hypothetical protein